MRRIPRRAMPIEARRGSKKRSETRARGATARWGGGAIADGCATNARSDDEGEPARDPRAGWAEQRVGTILMGKYRLERLLGVGSMSAVYQGTHRNGNRVAIKILGPALFLPPQYQQLLRDRFLREGYVANQVDHRDAVRALDDDTAEDGSVFLVMELLHGETLDAYQGRVGGRLHPTEVAELAYRLLDVLAVAHECGVIHRDIKPDNLFLTRDGRLKVLDFGLARMRGVTNVKAASTCPGCLLGTPAFMSPEQALGRTRDIDVQTDIWAVGATMFALISGCYVHDAETVEETLVYAGSRRARSLNSVARDTPPLLAAVIDRALEFDKAWRWPNARTMQAALEAAYDSSFHTSLPSRARQAAERCSAAADASTAPRYGPPSSTSTAGATDPARAIGAAWRSLPLRAKHATADKSSLFVAPLHTTALVVDSSLIGSRLSGLRDRRFVLGALAALIAAVALTAVTPRLAQPSTLGSPIVSMAGDARTLPSADAPTSTAILNAAIRRAPPSAPTKPSAKPAARARRTDCSLPFVIDSLGRRTPKEECF